MWKKGCDHDVVLLIFGTRFLAQTATEKHPNKHSVQNKCLKDYFSSKFIQIIQDLHDNCL